MKKQGPWLIYFVFMSAAISPISSSITKWGKVTPAKETVLISVGIACIVIALLVFRKYKLGSELNHNITNLKLRNVLIRYPLLLGLIPMLIGIAAGVLLTLAFG